MTILDKILREKQLEVERLLTEEIQFENEAVTRPSLFEKLVHTDHLQVIAEMKRASPSKGLIAEGANPVAQAKAYEQAGVACISVLTDAPFFKGSFDDLAAVADAVHTPLLCKDFIIDKIQIDKAKAAGASVILLIVSALRDDELFALHTYAVNAGLEVLVEVHDVVELERALKLEAKLIGVNNRDLRTFDVDLGRTEAIAKVFPFSKERVLISESGITGQLDAERVSIAGARAVLVGESLMRSGTVQEAIVAMQVELPGGYTMTKVKICGLKEQEHVNVAINAGADAIGFVFAPSSRQITIEEARELAGQIPQHILKIGVFVDAPREELERAFYEVPLDYVQLHGEETPEFIELLGLPTIKAFSVRNVDDVQEAAKYNVNYYLFDAPGTVYRGGSGVTFDWSLLQDVGISAEKLILAGGLHAENVGEAIERVKPFMVDVSSGVEREKRKDELLMRAFVHAVKDEER